MHYFLKEVFHTGKGFWVLVAFLTFAAIAIVDAFSAMFGNPVFGGKLVFVLASLLALSAAAYIVTMVAQDKKNRWLRQQLDLLEPDLRRTVQKKMLENPDFRTFCHECRHFDYDRLGCRLFLVERRNQVKIHEGDRQQYCLYWNYEFPLLLHNALLPNKWKEDRK